MSAVPQISSSSVASHIADSSEGFGKRNGRMPGSGLARRLYLPRVLGLALGSLFVAAGLAQHGAPHGLWLMLAFVGLVWPHPAYRWALRSPTPALAEHRNLMVDSLFGGFWITAMGFNLLPSTLIATMLGMSNMAVGGWSLFLRVMPAQVIGASLALGLLNVRFEPVPELAVVLACIPFMVIYPLLFGMVTWRLSQKLSQQREALRVLHEHDALSGLYSRAHWDTRLRQEFQRFQRYGRPVSLLLMDIDHFKLINDSHGHPAGDDAIRRVGALLRELVRPEDMVGRYGGEEFAAILAETTASQATQAAERIRTTLAATRMPIANGVQLTMSFGIAELSTEVPDCLSWIERADRALYGAKSSGRNQVRVSED